ncbi:MAG: hypothetical protein H6737_07065 [Alphaproteobacteria bacterium]|nr:hypothetical protein [Alphaproteobacteria bacterium]
MGIAEAIAALDADDWEGALIELVGIWGRTRSPALADALDALSDHATAALPPLDVPRKQLQTAWEARFGEAKHVQLGTLLAVLPDGTAKDVRARFDRLVNLPPDPRATPALMAFPDAFQQRSSSSRPAWTGYFRAVAHVADPRMRAPLEARRAAVQAVRDQMDDGDYTDFEDSQLEGIDRVLSKLPEPGETDLDGLDDAVARTVARPFAQRRASGVDPEALYAGVLRDPADTGAVLVWVDALLEAGDARGRFARLQLDAEERVLKPAEKKEMAALAKANNAVWLGSLGPSVEPRTARWRRGLLSSITAKPKRIKPAVMADPAWRTVEQLGSTVAHYTHPNLVSLKRIGSTLVPDPDDTRSIVGFAFDEHGTSPTWDEVQALLDAPPPGIVHLEAEIPAHAMDHARILDAFPDLEVIQLFSYHSDDRDRDPALVPWLSKIREVVLWGLGEHSGETDAWWLDALPRSSVHFRMRYSHFARSYVRRDDGVHAVFTELQAVYPPSVRDPRQYPNWFVEPLRFLTHLPRVASVSFRMKGTVEPEVIDAIVARIPAGTPNVTLPRAKA